MALTRDPVLCAASVVTLLTGLAGCGFLFVVLYGPAVSAELAVVLILLLGPALIVLGGMVAGAGLVVPLVFVVCGVLMLRGSVAAAAVVALLAAANVPLTGTAAVVAPHPAAVVSAATSLLTAALAIWAVFRLDPSAKR